MLDDTLVLLALLQYDVKVRKAQSFLSLHDSSASAALYYHCADVVPAMNPRRTHSLLPALFGLEQSSLADSCRANHCTIVTD